MPELVVGQAGKELTHNQALAVLDQLAQAVVVDKDLTAPPGSPANGSMYIVAAGATGAWSGQSGNLAYWLTTVAAWTFITPADGWSVWVTDEAVRYERKAGAWAVQPSGYVTGPAAATDNQIALFNGATGKLIKAGSVVGDAAYATKQTSVVDTTAGRLVIQGGSNLVATDTIAIGYGTGSGGTVTQATSKSTAVTLNKPTGRINTAADLLASGASVAFILTNSKITTADVVVIQGNQGNYRYEVFGINPGSVYIRITNLSESPLSEAIAINFSIIKGATA